MHSSIHYVFFVHRALSQEKLVIKEISWKCHSSLVVFLSVILASIAFILAAWHVSLCCVSWRLKPPLKRALVWSLSDYLLMLFITICNNRQTFLSIKFLVSATSLKSHNRFMTKKFLITKKIENRHSSVVGAFRTEKENWHIFSLFQLLFLKLFTCYWTLTINWKSPTVESFNLNSINLAKCVESTYCSFFSPFPTMPLFSFGKVENDIQKSFWCII